MSSQTPEDDRTVIRPTSASEATRQGVPSSAFPATSVASRYATQPQSSVSASSAGDSGNALPEGTFLGEFELTSVHGEGGFGIVYVAWDHSLERRVAIKEYMPAALAARTGPTQVQVKSARHEETFNAGLKSFVNEAKLLAQFDHPSVVKVYRFWEANGTAYMVMPFYEGITLKDQLRAMGTPPDEDWLMGLLAPLTEALSVVHSGHCYHRDIAPDNVILLNTTGKPLLLDFGAARRVIGDMTQALTVILKPGYAPVEQYAEAPGMKQGAWTDVYALAATVHFAILGKTPPPSVGRLMRDSYVPLAQSAAGRYSPRFLEALDNALRVRPEERTPTIDALRADLGLAAQAPASRPMPLEAQAPVGATLVAKDDATRLETRTAPQPAAQAERSAPAARPVETGSTATPGSRKPLWLGLGVVAVGGAALAAYLLLPAKPGTAPAPVNAQMPTPGPVAAPAPVAAPFDASEQIGKVLAAQSVGFTVEAVPAKQQLRIGRDRLSFTVKSARDGYVQVMVLGPDGSLVLLWPNTQSSSNRIKAGQTLTLPQASWAVETAEPVGPEQFLVVVSEHPRDFAVLSTEREYDYLKLPTGERATALAARWDRSTPMLLGGAGADCKGEGCDAYGAARFTVEVIR
jgi:serine/threonine protein kinase